MRQRPLRASSESLRRRQLSTVPPGCRQPAPQRRSCCRRTSRSECQLGRSVVHPPANLLDGLSPVPDSSRRLGGPKGLDTRNRGLVSLFMYGPSEWPLGHRFPSRPARLHHGHRGMTRLLSGPREVSHRAGSPLLFIVIRRPGAGHAPMITGESAAYHRRSSPPSPLIATPGHHHWRLAGAMKEAAVTV